MRKWRVLQKHGGGESMNNELATVRYDPNNKKKYIRLLAWRSFLENPANHARDFFFLALRLSAGSLLRRLSLSLSVCISH